MPKKGGKIRDKWREKGWFVVEAPASFGGASVAYIPLTNPERAVGRVVGTTLYDLLKQDPQQYAIKLYFQIDSIVGERAATVFKGHEYSREYLRGLIRRGSSMISLIKDYVTKDGVDVRVYFVAFTQKRVNTSRKHAVRMVAHRILRERTASLSYDQFAQEVVLGRAASAIYGEAKKIVQLRYVGIRKSRMVKKVAPPTPELVRAASA